MERKLIELGAPPAKVKYNPYGVDCERFEGAAPANSPPLFLAVGRFTEKKAPKLTISAFAATLREYPAARLRMIGDGPLLQESIEFASQLGVSDAIAFLGAQSHEVVEAEMKSARCFVQHSVVAPSGDCEGTPVSILEAGASGLPVISTRHAGIPDVVVEGRTGFLVDERDVVGMAAHMIHLAQDSELAGQLGAAARNHIVDNFSRAKRINQLWEIIKSCINNRPSSNSNPCS
jgi:glycosyltransferase involved in cell wall biosynthesis